VLIYPPQSPNQLDQILNIPARNLKKAKFGKAGVEKQAEMTS